MVILYKDPKGEKIFERTHSVSQMTATNCNFDDLEKHCKQLESRLGKYEVSFNSNVICHSTIHNIYFQPIYANHCYILISYRK